MKIIKFIFYFIIVLIIFAILPQSFFENLKNFFQSGSFFNTLKTGFDNLMKFIYETTGVDLIKFKLKLKELFGFN